MLVYNLKADINHTPASIRCQFLSSTFFHIFAQVFLHLEQFPSSNGQWGRTECCKGHPRTGRQQRCLHQCARRGAAGFSPAAAASTRPAARRPSMLIFKGLHAIPHRAAATAGPSSRFPRQIAVKGYPASQPQRAAADDAAGTRYGRTEGFAIEQDHVPHRLNVRAQPGRNRIAARAEEHQGRLGPGIDDPAP